MTQNLTPAERSKRAENAERVVLRHRGRDYEMTGASYGRLIDRAAAKIRGGRSASLSAAEQSLMAKAGWDAPPVDSPATRATDDELMARAGWAD